MLQKLQGKRWFIWTLVVIVVSMVSLATYMYTTAASDNYELSSLLSLRLMLHRDAAAKNAQPHSPLVR